ncbi:hypothetical protein JZO73_05800 [Enterococcus plantarum]|nr:hypothetical protein [Enterococcus plantarum]
MNEWNAKRSRLSMKKKKWIFLLTVILVVVGFFYLKFNYIKVPYLGQVPLIKWDASIDKHIKSKDIYYQRRFNFSELSEDKIVNYICSTNKSSSLSNLIMENPSKKELKSNFLKNNEIASSTLVSEDVLNHSQYKIITKISKVKNQYIYTIYVEKFS